MIKLLIVDDHSIVREGLKQILSDDPEIVVADYAVNGLEALEKIKKNEFNIVVLDIALPDMSGLDVLKEIKIIKPELSVLILTMYPEKKFAVQALKAGASGYITKGSGLKELKDALRIVSEGRKYVSTTLAEKLASDLETGSEKQSHKELSEREFEVMLKLVSGNTTKEIAYKLGLSSKTISTYRYRILTKMNLKNNVELLHYAIEHGLLNK